MDRGTAELLLANRSFLYSLAARGFAEEPDEAYAAVLRQPHTLDEVRLVREGMEEVERTFADMLDLLGPNGARLPELRVEYVRVLVGPGTLAADPWESMHETGRRVLFQRDMLPVREAYRAAGFLPVRYPAVADDHIALELDFLAKLAADACAAHGEGDVGRCARRLRESAGFLEAHLLRWADSYADAVERGCGRCFYGALARFAAAVAKRDATVARALL